MQQLYVAIIEKASHGFGVHFPDLPGCTSFGATLDDTAANASLVEARRSHQSRK
jgi:predicted RNase H-like HicB family nuclease